MLEEQELEAINETLLDGDRSWEQMQGVARSKSARSTLELGSSMKRHGVKQVAGKRRKRLKYDMVEDNWGVYTKPYCQAQPKSQLSLAEVAALWLIPTTHHPTLPPTTPPGLNEAMFARW